jgi:galactose mutarotase-like enzyme
MPLRPCPEPWPHWVWMDPRSGDELRLVPERGGLVSGWRCGGREILYLDAARFADPALSVRGGIPVLFPICGNLPGDALVLPQGTYHLPQHGFARDLPWTLTELDDPLGAAGSDGEDGVGGVRMELRDSPASREQFPFAFSLALELRLQPAALAITARLSHQGEPGGAALPFCLGLHPYFAVADPAAVRLEGLPAHCFDHRPMAEAATDSQLQRLGRGEGVDFLCQARGPVRLVDPLAGRVVTLESSAPMDLVVVWSDPPRPMLCLEPWTAPRGALLSGERRLTLDPGETFELRCRYSVATL